MVMRKRNMKRDLHTWTVMNYNLKKSYRILKKLIKKQFITELYCFMKLFPLHVRNNVDSYEL